MKYKKITPSNIDQLIEMWKILMGEHEKIEPKLYKLSSIAESKQREFFTNGINSQEKFLYGAFDKNQLVGYAFGWIEERPPVLKMQKIGNLSDIVIDPKYRGKEIGKKLADIFIDWCKKQGVKKVQLHVLFDKDAVGFYKKYGFRDFMRQMIIDIK